MNRIPRRPMGAGAGAETVMGSAPASLPDLPGLASQSATGYTSCAGRTTYTRGWQTELSHSPVRGQPPARTRRLPVLPIHPSFQQEIRIAGARARRLLRFQPGGGAVRTGQDSRPACCTGLPEQAAPVYHIDTGSGSAAAPMVGKPLQNAALSSRTNLPRS